MTRSRSKTRIRNRDLKLGVNKSQVWCLIMSTILFLGSMLCVVEVKAEAKPGLAIIPFIVEKEEAPGRGATCPVCKRVFRRTDVPPGARDTVTRLLQQKVEALGGFDVISLEKVEETISKFGETRFEQVPASSALEIGKELRVNYVMMGFLGRFEERIGSSLGVERPASVGFDLHLYRLKDGKIVWEAGFDETQKSLSEDLFKIGEFFKRGASWLKAAELAGAGMDKILRTLPPPKELEAKK